MIKDCVAYHFVMRKIYRQSQSHAEMSETRNPESLLHYFVRTNASKNDRV